MDIITHKKVMARYSAQCLEPLLACQTWAVGGIQNLTIHWEKSPQARLSSPGPSKTPPNTLPGLAPLISCILTFPYALLAPTGCSISPFLPPETTILIPVETQQWSVSSDMAPNLPKSTLSGPI